MSSVACRVCLRTDVKTLDLPDQLKTFHNELCDFETVKHKRLKYCTLCIHQLKKCYKYKKQCQQANGLLKLWIKDDNKDISEYHKELPSPSLEFTNNSTSFLFECNHDEKTLHNTNVTSDSKQNMLLKMNKSSLAPDDIIQPQSSEHFLNSNPSLPNRPNPDVRPNLDPTPDIKPNDGPRPSFKPKIFIRKDLRSILKTEHIKGENGILTIGPTRLSVQSRPDFRPKLGPTLAFRPTDVLRPRFRPKMVKRKELRSLLKTEHVKGENGMLTIGPNLLSLQSSASSPNLSLKPALKHSTHGLSIQLVPSSNKQTDLTLDPDFDVSYETDPLSIAKDGNAMAIDKNTIDKVEEESLVEIEKQEVYMDDKDIEMDDAIASEIEIELKTEDKNECNIDNTLPEEESKEMVNSDNDADSDEWSEQDNDLLDLETETKQETSESTNPEDVSNKNFLQHESIIPLEAYYNTNYKRIMRNYEKETYKSHGFKAGPPFQVKMLRLLDEKPLVLEDETVLTKELFSVICEKCNAREGRRLERLLLKDEFRAKLTAYLGVLYRKYNPEYETIFRVEYFHTEEMKYEEFKRRALHPDYISADYKCELCYQTYSGQGNLDFHKKIHHNPANPVVCNICSCRTPTRARLIKHRLYDHQAAYSCKLCTFRTIRAISMRTHYNSHKGAQYQCPVCLIVCANAHTLRNHKRREHATHPCTTCAQQYSTERGLRVHRETQHKDAPPADPAQAVPCVDCDVTFDTREAYQRHRSITHRNYRSRGERRVRTRRPGPPAKREYKTCEICHEKVSMRFGGFLYKHFLEKHPGVPYHAADQQQRDLLCEECGKAFACNATLQDHKNLHTGLRPHACELCPARFHTKSRLWSHRANKHCEPRLRCHHCGKMFKTASHLRTHIKIHIGIRSHKCEICDKDFLHSFALKEHVKGVHYKERRVKKPRKPAQEI